MRYLSVCLTAAMLLAAACGGSPTAPTPQPTSTPAVSAEPGPAAPAPTADGPSPTADPPPGDSADPAPGHSADPVPPPPVPAAYCDGDSPGITVVQNLIHDGRLLVSNNSADCTVFGMAIYLLPPGARDTDPQIPNQRLYAFQNVVIPRGGTHLFDLNTSLQALECGRWLQFDLYVNMDNPPDPPTTEGFHGNQIDLNKFGGAYYQKPCLEDPVPPTQSTPIPLTCDLLDVSLQAGSFSTSATTVTVPVIARWSVAGTAQLLFSGTSVTPAAYKSGDIYEVQFPRKNVASVETIEVKVTHPAGLVCSAAVQVSLPPLLATPVCPVITPENMKQYVQNVSLVPSGVRELAATFTVTPLLPAGCTIKLMHDAWLLETPGVFLPQKLLTRVTGEFGPGTHTLVLKIERADCYWQNDLLLFDSPALLINRLDESNQPFYTTRLLDARYDWHGCTLGGG